MSSPAVRRATRVLDFLAAYPGHEFSLSEIARRLEISKTTIHSLLAELTASGYVVREAASQRFRLGPALIPLGDVAERVLPGMAVARAQADALAERVDVQCLVTWASDREEIVLYRSGVARPSSFTGQPGQRLPLIPPFGTMFLAWAGEERIEDWLSRLGASAGASELDRYRATLASIRERGYAVGFQAPAYDRITELGLDQVHTEEAQRQVVALLGEMRNEAYVEAEIGGADDRRLRYISAPVFDHEARLLMILSLLLDDRFSGADHERLGGEMFKSTATVMQAIEGRRPEAMGLQGATPA